MNLSLPQVVAMGAGALLIYAAIKGESPIEVLKNALTNQPLPRGGNPTTGSNAVNQSGPNIAMFTGVPSSEAGKEMTTGTSGKVMTGTPTKQVIVGNLKTGI